MSRYIPVKGLVGSWLTPDRYQEGGALGYKSMGRSHIHDSIMSDGGIVSHVGNAFLIYTRVHTP